MFRALFLINFFLIFSLSCADPKETESLTVYQKAALFWYQEQFLQEREAQDAQKQYAELNAKLSEKLEKDCNFTPETDEYLEERMTKTKKETEKALRDFLQLDSVKRKEKCRWLIDKKSPFGIHNAIFHTLVFAESCVGFYQEKAFDTVWPNQWKEYQDCAQKSDPPLLPEEDPFDCYAQGFAQEALKKLEEW